MKAEWSRKLSKLRIAGIIGESIVDGPGIRLVVFAQGCNHYCKGCHNPKTFDINGGYEIEIDEVLKQVRKNPILKGVTFSGGEPFLQAMAFFKLAKLIHSEGLDVISYTGYTFEELLKGLDKNPYWSLLLENIDILIDGPFIEAEKSLITKFRGSKNQRILDAKRSLFEKKAIEIEL